MSSASLSAKTTGITILLCGAATFFIFIQVVIFGSNSSNLIMMNPLLSGYLHLSMSHFLLNMGILLVALLPNINKNYSPLKIFYITTIISLLYLPIEALGLTQVAIGISGTCYFLISRCLLGLKERRALGVLGIGLLAFIEIGGFFGSPSGAAHGVHLIGMALGFISLKYDRRKILSP